MSPDREHPLDPILAKRRQIARLVDIGQRVGYGLFGIAIIGFALGLTTGWSDTYTVVVIGSLLVGSVILAPAIIFGYAVKAAEREDLDGGHHTH